MDHDPNLRESNVNSISRFTICGNGEICEWQFTRFFVISSEESVRFCVISREIAKIIEIGRDLEIIIQKWSETLFL